MLYIGAKMFWGVNTCFKVVRLSSDFAGERYLSIGIDWLLCLVSLFLLYLHSKQHKHALLAFNLVSFLQLVFGLLDV